MNYIFLNPDETIALGLLLIVKAPTGIIYAQQCGGFATIAMSTEGFLIPVGGEDEAKIIFDWFWEKFKGHCYQRQNAWTSELVTELGNLVGKIPCWFTTSNGDDQRHFLELDTSKMDECIEAWIPVNSPYGSAILTLKNSD
jgi:hypothetical protein